MGKTVFKIIAVVLVLTMCAESVSSYACPLSDCLRPISSAARQHGAIAHEFPVQSIAGYFTQQSIFKILNKRYSVRDIQEYFRIVIPTIYSGVKQADLRRLLNALEEIVNGKKHQRTVQDLENEHLRVLDILQNWGFEVRTFVRKVGLCGVDSYAYCVIRFGRRRPDHRYQRQLV